MQELTVTVAGLRFSGTRGPFVIGPKGFDGWDDGVSMRVAEVERPNAHGYHDLPSYMNPRTVSITGYALAESSLELRSLRSRLTGLLADGSTGRIQVSRDGWTEWANCKLATEGTAFDEVYGQNYADYQIQLWCPDPRKFGESREFVQSAPGDVLLFHRGNFAASPKVVVTGSAPSGYDLWGPDGRRYSVSRPLVSGRPHRINFDDGLLMVDGIYMSSEGPSDVWTIPPGQKRNFGVSTPSGSAQATVTVTDTYT